LIKLIAGAMLMAVMFYIGIAIERFYKKRADCVVEFADFLSYASREISFLKTDILSVMGSFIKDGTTPFKKMLAEVKTAFEKGTPLSFDNAYLTAGDKDLIKKFFNGIKKSDFQEQERLFKRTAAETNESVKVAIKQKKEKGELIKKLFILAGVGLMIVII